MDWLNTIIPSCCSKRPSNPIIQSAQIYSSTIESINIEPDNKSFEKNQMQDPEDLRLQSSEFNVIKLIPCFESTNSISRAATDSSLRPNDQATIILKCSICNNPADGFCVACPYKKFCKNCHTSQHSQTSPLHKFCKYSQLKNKH